jgi:hypothetical protein
MRQPSLFDPPPKPLEKRPMNLDVFRNRLGRHLYSLKNAQYAWSEERKESAEKDFSEYLQYLPAEEQEEMMRVYKIEMERLQALDAA